VASGVPEGPRVAHWYGEPTDVWLLIVALAVTAAAGALMTVLMLSILRPFLRRGETWQRPSWRAKPSLRDTAQQFHLFAWFAIAGGISALLSAFWVPNSSLQGGVMITGFGLGMLGGLHGSVRIYPGSFSGS